VALLFVDQLALLFPIAGQLRIILRMGPFLASLLLLIILPRQGPRHPATKPALAALLILSISILNPSTDNLLAGVAQAALYLAILGPLFWATRLQLDWAAVRSVLLILWGFHTLSAVVGILQVYFPGQFQPSLSAVFREQGEDLLESLRITTASGESVFRPMGLTDMPGGAALAGFYALLLGAGILLTERRTWLRAACVASMTVGMTCLYLSQIRAVLVLAVLCMLVFTAMLGWRRQVAKLGVLVALLGAVTGGSFLWAVALGGESVTSRLATFTSERPDQVFYTSRGQFLEHTIDELLPRYPFGAGVGQWGMMNLYFGDTAQRAENRFYVEIQWTGWLFDGGVPLILAYVAALLLAIRAAWHLSRRRVGGSEVAIWGALLLAYNIGALANTFTYPLFISQSGMEFWLLNGILFGVACAPRRPVSSRTGAYG
jgi:hypothetical protein